MTTDWQSVMRMIFTIILSITGISALLGYFYLSMGRFYQYREKRWWVGMLAFVLPGIALLFGLFIWMMWDSRVATMFWYLFGFSLFVDFILYQSVTSPYKMADWWLELNKWLQGRKTR